VPPEKVHCTLVFLGADDRIGLEARERLRRSLRHLARQTLALPVVVGGLGIFKNPGREVIYARVEDPTFALAEFRERVAELCRAAGAEPSGGSVQSVAGTVDVERSVDEQRQGAPEPSVQISEPETNGEHDAEKTIERTTPRAKSILADIPDFDRRVLGRLRMEPPKTNLRMQVIAHEFKRPEEEIRAAVRRLAALGLAGFGNRFRRDAHATYQPTLAGKPVDEWLPLAMEHISGAPKISIAALAHALGMEREEAIQICTMLEQRGTIRLSGPGKSLVEAKSMNERVAARKTRKGSMTSPTMASKSGDELTRRTSGTAKAEQVLSIRPTSPPTRRVQHADC
jgi:DNA-binding Lrp family transcriptional regulator